MRICSIEVQQYVCTFLLSVVRKRGVASACVAVCNGVVVVCSRYCVGVVAPCVGVSESSAHPTSSVTFDLSLPRLSASLP